MPGATPAPRPAALPRSLRALLAAAVLVPLLLLVGAGFYDWRRLHAEARDDVLRLAAIVKEHALKVVETNALVLDRLEDRVRGLSWADIEAQGADIHRDIRRMDESIAQITALHMVRPDGRVVLLSTAWPIPPLDISGRDYFQAIARGHPGLAFGRPTLSRLSGQYFFAMARSRLDAEGGFDGAFVGSILPDYFQAHWQALGLRRAATISLLRGDGLVLATLPRPVGEAADTPGTVPVPEAVLRGGATAPLIANGGAGEAWLTAFQRVGDYPLAVTVGLSRDAIRAEWMANMAITAILCLCAVLALIAVTLLAIRRWRSEQATLARLSATAEELRAEIARREAAEAGLMQAQRLEALGRLTGGIAHDFNNLLTAILGTVQLLERHLGAGADDRSRRLLGVARDAVNRGARLNASLLAFARRQKLRTTALDANALVQGFTPLIKGALGEAISLTVELERELPPCHADTAQLEAALLNLAINARDAMPAGAGHCVLATRLAQLGPAELGDNAEAKPGAYVAISLRDSGHGMPPEVRDRAFEPFFTTKPLGRGTGLGLSQVFGFVRQLGGHVAIDSAVGQGTTITLYLPVDAEGTEEDREGGGHWHRDAAIDPAHLAGVTVLVAEDDARVREVTAETLRAAGMRVLTAADGQEALAILRRGGAVDVLFSDIVMPGGLSGIDLAREAQRLSPGLPVLLATGYAGTIGDREDHGFEVLPKPYDQDALARRLAELALAQARTVA